METYSSSALTATHCTHGPGGMAETTTSTGRGTRPARKTVKTKTMSTPTTVSMALALIAATMVCVDAGAAVPPPDVAAYAGAAQPGSGGQAHQGEARAKSSSSAAHRPIPPAFGGRLPGISSQLKLSPRSRAGRRQAVAAQAQAQATEVEQEQEEEVHQAAPQTAYERPPPPPPPPQVSVSPPYSATMSSGTESPNVSPLTSPATPIQPPSQLVQSRDGHVRQQQQLGRAAAVPKPQGSSDTAATIKPTSTSTSSLAAPLFMALLALQFGLQPLLVRRFTPPSINRSTVVLVQEIIKLVIASSVYLRSTTQHERRNDLGLGTTTGGGGGKGAVMRNLGIAALPAALYTIQNLAALLAYQNLDPVAFNVLNQTKTLSAALCCWLVLGTRQSRVQMGALGMLLSAALVLEKIIPVSMFLPGFGGAGRIVGGGGIGAASSSVSGGGGSIVASVSGVLSSLTSGGMARRVTHGVLPILLASFISGLAGSLVQKAVQGHNKRQEVDHVGTSPHATSGKQVEEVPPRKQPRNFYLFSVELGVASILLMLTSFVFSADGRRIVTHGFFHNWTPATLVPILTQSAGGIVVGLVTKHAGSVRKGFALIFGMLLSGVFQACSSTTGFSLAMEQVVGLGLAATSLWMYTKFPYRHKEPSPSKPRRLAVVAPAGAPSP